MIGIRHNNTFAPLSQSNRSLDQARWLIFIIVLIWLASLFAGFKAGLTAIFIMGLALTVLGLKHPALGLFGVTLLSTIDAPGRVYILGGGLLRWNTVNYLLLFFLLLYIPFVLRMHNPHIRLALAFSLWMGIQLIITPDLGNGLQHILGFLSYIPLTVIFARAFFVDNRVLWYASILCGITAALGNGVFYADIQQLEYINPNAGSLFPLLGVFGVILGLEHERLQGRAPNSIWLPYTLIAVNYAWVFLSGSRGNTIIATIAAVAFILSQNPFRSGDFSKWRTMLIMGTAVLVFIGVQFGDLQQQTINRFDTLFNTELSAKSRTSGRSELIEGGFFLFQQHPFGVGTGGYTVFWTTLDSADLGLEISTNRELSAHSGWIKILAENGIVGIAIFSLFVISFMARGWALRHEGKVLVGTLASIVIGIALISTEFQGKILWYICAYATVVIHHQELKLDWRDAIEKKPFYWKRR